MSLSDSWNKVLSAGKESLEAHTEAYLGSLFDSKTKTAGAAVVGETATGAPLVQRGVTGMPATPAADGASAPNYLVPGLLLIAAVAVTYALTRGKR